MTLMKPCSWPTAWSSCRHGRGVLARSSKSTCHDRAAVATSRSYACAMKYWLTSACLRTWPPPDRKRSPRHMLRNVFFFPIPDDDGFASAKYLLHLFFEAG